MPSHTTFPPSFRAEAELWNDLLKLDDGSLHLWYGVALGWGIEAQILLLDSQEGAFCIEAKCLPLSQIRFLDLQSIARADGVASVAPFGQAIEVTQYLASVLDKTWDDRPDIVPVAAFPLISRSEWNTRFCDEPIGEYGARCLLMEDLADLETLRMRLKEIAEKPINGRTRSRKFKGLADGVFSTMDTTLVGRTRPMVDPADNSEPDVLSLLDETIKVVKGPGAAYHSAGLDSLVLWKTALSHVNERLRISVVGEFKSGKSSLINAILGCDACYVDEFEATTINATYRSGPAEKVEVLNQQNIEETWTLQEFLERCANRDLGDVRQVVVTLPTKLPFDLVDSPGLGTRTEGHAAEAEMEIRRTDLLLWTVDSNDPGSAREGAFIQRAREVGLPLIVLLTKCDQLAPDEVAALVEYVSNETGIPKHDVLPVSAYDHAAGKSKEIDHLVQRLNSAAHQKVEFQADAYEAKLREAIDGSISTLRFLVEINAPNARYLAAERGYLETSALGIGTAAKREWIRALREECAQVAHSIASKSIEDADVVELMLRKALPPAVNRATTNFMQTLRKLVRDEWRNALEQRCRDLEARLTELTITRPDAKADLDFLRDEAEAFRIRAEVVFAETDPAPIDNRLLIVGLGAAASVITVSILPIAVAGVVAAVAVRQKKGLTGSGADSVIAAHIEEALIAGFEKVADQFERAIERIVIEVAQRSLITLVNRRGGPDYQTIQVIERRGCQLMDDLVSVRRC